MNRPPVSLAVRAALAASVALAASCKDQDPLPEGNSNNLAGTACDTCDPATYPHSIVCPQGARVSCWRQMDGTCKWGDRCPGTGAGGPISGGGTGGAGGGGGAVADAGGGAPAACTQADCAGQPVPAIGCADGSSPRFSCVRGADGRCRWSPPVCPARDAAPPPPPRLDASGTGVACGRVTCAPGLVCCNASCGTCVQPGMACIQVACDPPPPRPDAAVATDAGSCRSDADCRLFDDYCTGCDCRALSRTDPDPRCSGPGVRCFAPPCMNKVAACEAGRCVVRDGTAAATKWYFTCGDPVCRGYTGGSGLPKCTTEKAGNACPTADAKCDPQDSCNRLLVCSVQDPTQQPGGCPISRRDAKGEIKYLGPSELERLREELLGMKLATWRYKHDPARERLGFIIEDQPPASPAVDPGRALVDLYGYASLAVATIQTQAKEIEALRRELAEVKRALERRAPARPRRPAR
jgi:hypothetical protein